VSTIEFACPYCDRQSRVPASFAGKQGKCPGCQKVIEVPDPNEGAPPPDPGSAPTMAIPPEAVAPTVLEPPPTSPPPRNVGKPPAKDEVFDVSPRLGGAPVRSCPACAEPLAPGATRCRSCGEASGPTPAPMAAFGPVPAGGRATVMPSGLDYLLCVLCSTIGCIVAIVLLLQGYTKRGAIMLVVSLVASVAWQFVAVIASAILNSL
jgi:hypothetical protein